MPRMPRNTTILGADDQPTPPGAPLPPITPTNPPQSPTPGIPPTSGPTPSPQVPPSSYNPGLVASFDKTNLDIEDARPNGGIPYQQAKDPTIYPSTTQAQTPERGYFATPGKAASKFEQKYSPKNTYLDFIKNYI